MKRIAVAATLSVAAVTSVAVAVAASNQYAVQATVKPAKAGTKAKPAPVAVTTSFTIGEAGGLRPAAISHYEFAYAGIKVNGKAFPTCAAARINAAGSDASCPKGSLVGTGTTKSVSGMTSAPGDKQYACTLDIKEYNAPKDHLAIYLTATAADCSGTTVNRAIDAKYVGGTSGKGRLVYDVPSDLLHAVAGITSATVSSTTTVKKVTRKVKGRTVGYQEAIGGCTGGTRAVTITFRTEDGQTGKATTAAAC